MQPGMLESRIQDDSVYIEVCDPIEKEGLKNFVVYCVKGQDSKGAFEVYRRYSDFYALRKEMLRRWPGIYIPEIPPKKAVGNMNKEFVEKRKNQLSRFVVCISNQPNIYFSEEFQLFIRSSSQCFKKALENMPPLSYADLIARLKQAFPDLAQKETSIETEVNISQFAMFVKKIKGQLGNFKDIAKSICQAKQQFQESFQVFQNHMLPEYERICITEYMRDDSHEHQEEEVLPATSFLKNLKDDNALKKDPMSCGYQHLETILQQEMLSIEAMNDALQAKMHYEQLTKENEAKQKELQLDLQKVVAGKTTMRTLFKKGAAPGVIRDIEEEIGQLQKDHEDMSQICALVTAILFHLEINKFKGDKVHKYFLMLSRLSEQEMAYSLHTLDFWKSFAQFQAA